MKNCPDRLIYYTTDVYPLQPPYGEFICMHLFLFEKIIFYSWSTVKIFLFFLSMITFLQWFAITTKVSSKDKKEHWYFYWKCFKT